MSRIFIKPISGVMVKNPDNNDEYLSQDGEEVENTTYWQRRMIDGDVEIVKPPKSNTKGE